jgi:type IV pilus assembly protein PilW
MLTGLQRAPQSQLGLSLVELMVGIAIGLIVVAAATLLFSGQLAESRRLIAEAQVQQDVRISADLMARELRRGGAVGQDSFVQARVWDPSGTVEPLPDSVTALLSPVGTDDQVVFNYLPGGVDDILVGGFGFRLNETTGVIETRLVTGGWQGLTDPATMQVTVFSVTRIADSVATIPCSKPCPSGDTSCWPSVNQRTLEIRVTARHRTFPEIERTHVARVRLRNDQFRFFFVNPVSITGRVCPA